MDYYRIWSRHKETTTLFPQRCQVIYREMLEGVIELPSSEGKFIAYMLKHENLDHFKTKLSYSLEMAAENQAKYMSMWDDLRCPSFGK